MSIGKMKEVGSLVILTENDPLVRRRLSLFLQESGYLVQSASDGDGALSLWSELSSRIALVMLDVGESSPLRMEALREIRHADRDLPIFVYSKPEEVRRATEALRIGATAVLTKPLDFKSLIEMMRSALYSPSAGTRQAGGTTWVESIE